MMGDRRVDQGALFYEFCLERHVPQDHLLRAIDRFVDLEGVRAHLASFYSPIGRPSIDPELLIRMLLVGYCLVYAQSVGSARRSISTSPTGGSAALAWTATCRITRPSRRTAASLIKADANKQRSAAAGEDVDWEGMAGTRRSVRECLETLDDAASGAASEVEPKFVSRSDPAAQWTGAHKGDAFFAYATNYLIDLDHAVIVDVGHPARSAKRRSGRPAP